MPAVGRRDLTWHLKG